MQDAKSSLQYQQSHSPNLTLQLNSTKCEKFIHVSDIHNKTTLTLTRFANYISKPCTLVEQRAQVGNILLKTMETFLCLATSFFCAYYQG